MVEKTRSHDEQPANPWLALLDFQATCMDAWCRCMVEALAAQQRIIQHGAKLVEHRIEHHGHWLPGWRGADWFDHYGHRAHDVTVERL